MFLNAGKITTQMCYYKKQLKMRENANQNNKFIAYLLFIERNLRDYKNILQTC